MKRRIQKQEMWRPNRNTSSRGTTDRIGAYKQKWEGAVLCVCDGICGEENQKRFLCFCLFALWSFCLFVFLSFCLTSTQEQQTGLRVYTVQAKLGGSNVMCVCVSRWDLWCRKTETVTRGGDGQTLGCGSKDKRGWMSQHGWVLLFANTIVLLILVCTVF